jgi:hypothetical protein
MFKITIDKTQVFGSHTNFPFLFTDECGTIPDGFWGHVTDITDGLDIRFYASDMITELKREIASFNPATKKIQAWVQIPTLVGIADPVIWCDYGGATVVNSTSMWTDIGAEEINHLENNHGEYLGGWNSAGKSPAQLYDTIPAASARIGAGYKFGTDNDTNLGGYRVQAIPFTRSAWVYITSDLSDGYMCICIDAIQYSFLFGITSTDPSSLCGGGSGWFISSLSGGAWVGISSGHSFASQKYGWHHVVATCDGTFLRIYVDGNLMGTSTALPAPTPLLNNTYIGKTGTLDMILYGIMDELRYFTDAKYGTWIATEHVNQADPDIFYQCGPELGVVADFIGNPLLGVMPLSVQFTDISAGGPDSWNWDLGDGNVSSEQNPIHSYQNGGKYTVTLVARDPLGGVSTMTKIMYVTVYSVEVTANPTSGPVPLSVRFDAELILP